MRSTDASGDRTSMFIPIPNFASIDDAHSDYGDLGQRASSIDTKQSLKLTSIAGYGATVS